MPRAFSLRPTESQEQIAFVDSVLLKFSHRLDFLRPLFNATLSGHWLAGNGARKAALVEKYKREGWTNGVADILYLQPRGPYSYLAIEMKAIGRKAERNGGLSDDQCEWLDAARKVGALAMVCYGAEEAESAFCRYMEYPA